jgi:uncharacterized caspase-like protein
MRSRCQYALLLRRILLGLVFALFLLPVAANARERVALVVGNSSYRNAPLLPNPRNDASDVGDAFQRLGFSVTRVADATFNDLQSTLRGFAQAARDADMAVVYFAGHGAEVGGTNWLIPTDATIRSAGDIEQEAISLDLVMRVVGDARFGMIILDACRENPFATMAQKVGTRGLARAGLAPVQPKANILVAYAARDGTTASDGNGRNSPFTVALLRNLETPGLEVELMFRRVRDAVMQDTHHQQQPFVYGTLTRQAIYFRPPGATPVSPAPPPPKETEVIAACDLLAASPQDEERPNGVAGVEVAKMDAVSALSACEAAIAQSPGIGRLYFEQGRAALALKSVKRADELLEKASALGSSIAAYTLGVGYLQGIGVEKDESLARSWLKRAVELGNKRAKAALGLLYSLEPSKADDANALELFKQVAEEDPVAMNGLGVFYETGRQVPLDYALARSWYEKAAARGNEIAMRNLGSLYERGLGVRKDKAAAKKWYDLAASAGKARAQPATRQNEVSRSRAAVDQR